MDLALALVSLFAVATVVALVARRFKVPYTVALVVAGLALGSARALEAPHLTQELLYTVFLPGLLFEAAFALEFKSFAANKVLISTLALPGLVVGIALTTALLVPSVQGLAHVEGFTFTDGVIFAAVIAATDPIAVVALFKSMGAPKRLSILVEGESLLNDGTAIVVFTMVLGVATGGAFSVGGTVLEFVRVVGLGLLIGAVIGLVVSAFIHKVDDPMIEITLTTIAAYGSFVLAERYHASGVIAVVVAGMLCGNYAARTGMSPTTRIAVSTFWEYLAFALNSLVFLLIGFEVRLEALLAAWQPIVLAWVAMTVGRAAVVFLAQWLLRRTKERFDRRWAAVLTWGGLRGGLSMVLALGLPLALAQREIVQTMTFGVVILSILVQGLTMGPLLRGLGLVDEHAGEQEYEKQKARARAARLALDELGRVERDTSPEAVAPLRQELTARIEAARQAMEKLNVGASGLAEAEARRAAVLVLTAEKDALLAEARAGRLSSASCDELVAELDARLIELSRHG